jgi:ATP-dependent metalloprotease FtsH
MKVSASIDVLWQLAMGEAVSAEFGEIAPEHFLEAILKLAELNVEDLHRLAPDTQVVRLVSEDVAAVREELNARGINSKRARRELRGLLGKGGSPHRGGDMHRSPASREVFEAAARLAADAGSETLMALHLLQALLASPSPPMLLVLGEAVGQKAEPAPAGNGQAKEPVGLQQLTERLRAMRGELLTKVFGQDHAIHAFIEGLFNAEVVAAADEERRAPRAIFVFAGPPGVGKTFLAETGAGHLARPFKRFDMSAYSGHQQSEALVGMAKSFHAAHPGLLTEFVEQNPNAVLLFDEIEKAHANTIHLFLQILDAGSLEDKYHERNVAFRDTTIIFTTNAGRSLYERPNASGVHRASAAFHRKTILDALENEKNPHTREPFFPTAICSRMATGYPVLFNHLQVNDLERVVRAEVTRVGDLFERQYGRKVTFHDLIPMCLVLREGARADARTLRSQAEAFVKTEIFKFCQLFRTERLDEVMAQVERIHFTLEGDPTAFAPEVRALFETAEPPRLLLLAGEEWASTCRKAAPAAEWFTVDSPEEALQILATQAVDVALLDLWLGGSTAPASGTVFQFDHAPVAAKGLSRGQEFLRKVHERLPNLPVFLLAEARSDQEGVVAGGVDEELVMACVRAGGASGMLVAPSPAEEGEEQDELLQSFAAELLSTCKRLHREKAAARMGDERKALTFDTAPQMGGQSGEVAIRLRNLSLTRAIAAADAGEVLEDVERPRVRFDEVIGADGAKEELKFFIDYLKNPRRFSVLGLKPPKGVLLYGPPGTGKTMLARAMAGESNVAFLQASASSFVTMWQGSGPQSVRDLFERARRYAPAIVFIGEIDAVGKVRMGGAGGARATEETLNALLTEMDGFTGPSADRPVFVLAATNFSVEAQDPQNPERSARTLDPALVRRFSRSILVDLPDTAARRRYLALRLREQGKAEVSDGALDLLAEKSAGMSIANMEQVIEAAGRAAARKETAVTDDLLLEALDTAREGEAKEWSPEFLESTARHEAGHTLMYWLSGWWSPEVSIVARADHGGGMRRCEDEMKRESQTREEMLARIRTCLGGRAAEMLYYGEAGLTTGASGDLQHATGIARQMICGYGMDEEFGLLAVPELLQHAEALSSPLYQKVSESAARILAEQMARTLSLLKENQQHLDALAEGLLRKNRLHRTDLQEILPACPAPPSQETR